MIDKNLTKQKIESRFQSKKEVVEDSHDKEETMREWEAAKIIIERYIDEIQTKAANGNTEMEKVQDCIIDACKKEMNKSKCIIM